MPLGKPKIRQAWNEENMREAISNVKEKRMGWRLAAKTFNVPATTLRRRFKKDDSATPANAINAFSKTGIVPFNREVFEDWMFAPSLTTDQPLKEQSDNSDKGKK